MVIRVLFVILATASLGLLIAGVREQRRHFRNLRLIPHRVLVNGIRGKSSITRLCAGALRGGGQVVVAKTTGTAARLIFPDGSEEPVHRKFGIANVVEQIGIIRRAAAYFPDTVVIECMAVMPALQELNQEKLIQSNIGVLCNVREDHVEEMGPTLDDIARSLSRSMPVGGVCVTAERERLALLEREAARRDCTLVAVDPETVSDEELARFHWITFKDNVAIALKVAELLGVPRRAALAGMWAAPPDPGALTVSRYALDSGVLAFANVFAANDPQSTLDNIRLMQDRDLIAGPLHVVINCRPDRMERNAQMGTLIEELDPDRVVLIGDPTRSARSTIGAAWHDRVLDLGGRRTGPDLRDAVLRDLRGDAAMVAVGNIHGQGEVLLAQLAGLPPADAAPPASEGAAPAAAPRQRSAQSLAMRSR
ncbi:poly-gamma-glutamate synthase PgsB [Pilimelia anulata]|uniref:Poly-gamma-glutamate synthase PgsB n=1 Tax=Pilimelia anulata TaxID=53371 RepID=A0A8J3AZY3_9ACTN|nr:poly-gamma-glutamate synthase PgsB [Pilimelia anulata]GGJ78715.1 poly-gamma-glutamate synthase PgsB [Pilimelia anulata]